MKKHNQKGFTIVELVIVIAVIAILAAVLIPTFSNIVKKANLSNDQSMIRQMNTTLAIESIPDKFDYAGDALQALNGYGFDGKYKPFSAGFHYGYHLESNTMYLINDENSVIYPNSDVALTDLWVLWQNRTLDKVTGANKYVALVNITNQGYYATHFAEGTYTIDLADHYINANKLDNVTVVNGLLIKGANKSESDSSVNANVELKELDKLVAGETYTNVIIDGQPNQTKINGSTFKDSYFFNSSALTNTGVGATFENCTFYDSASYIFSLGQDGGFKQNLTVKNCTFINCKRVFNIPLATAYGASDTIEEQGTIIIDGNTFYGITDEEKPFIQLSIYEKANTRSGEDNNNDYNAGSFKDFHQWCYTTIVIKNNNFAEMFDNQDGLIHIHAGIIEYTNSASLTADHITFENNTVDGSISSDKYIVNDDGKADSEFANYYASTLKQSLIEKFVNGKK